MLGQQVPRRYGVEIAVPEVCQRENLAEGGAAYNEVCLDVVRPQPAHHRKDCLCPIQHTVVLLGMPPPAARNDLLTLDEDYFGVRYCAYRYYYSHLFTVRAARGYNKLGVAGVWG